jgi:hypothetical protein
MREMESPTVTDMPSRRERRRAVAQTIAARRRLETEPRPRGRVWINGREVDGIKPGLDHLGRSHD